MRRRLPIGIQSLAKLRGEGCYYVDKTPFIARLAHSGGYYFLSRPRRFGKSLFLDTLAEAFAGNRALFEGLYLAGNWDWERRHPVIRLSFTAGVMQDRMQLDHYIHVLIEQNAAALGLALPTREEGVAVRFDVLIGSAASRYGQRAVVLVDEYDKPILDNLTRPDMALQLREGLRNLYSVIKGRDADLRFVFLTGVSKFSKVSIFSGLNNLVDITLDRRYATLCGYTDADIDTVFAPELEGIERERLRHWYNGYRWGETPVYNPFDVLLLFDKREFRPWWFETGTPTFLVEWLKARQFFTPRLEQMFGNEALLSAFDVDRIEPEAMLWQTGYLTLRQTIQTPAGPAYYLGTPNHEVRTALNEALLMAWLPEAKAAMERGLKVYEYLAQGDVAGLHAHFERLYAAIPHDWYRNNPIAQYEGYYASVFYSHLAALGLDIVAEDVSSQGQCDLAVRHAGRVYLVEFKLTEGEAPTGEALAQLKARGYADKYRGQGPITLLGVEFSKTRRQIVGWQAEEVI